MKPLSLCRKLLLLTTAALLPLSFAQTAHAQSSAPDFQCTADPYVVIGSPSQLQQLNVSTGAVTTIGTAPININGIGYNIEDDYIYGLETATKTIYRMGADASVENLGVPSGTGTFNPDVAAGTMDSAGNWYGLNANTLFIVSVGDTPAAGSLTYTTRPLSGSTASGIDYAFSSVDNALYHNRNNRLYRIDPVTGVGSIITTTGDAIGSLSGGAWSTADGTMYFYNNVAGVLRSVDLTQSPPVVTIVRNVAKNGHFDGAACMPPSLTKRLLPSSNPVAGGTLVYEFTLSNAFQTSVSIDFDDTLSTTDMTFDTGSLTPAIPGGGIINSFTTTQLNISDITIPGQGSTVFQVSTDISSTITDDSDLANAATLIFGSTTFDSAGPGGPGPTTVVIDSKADLVTVKTLTSASATPAEGETVTFDITVTNNGAANATNVNLTDSLPAGLTATTVNGTATAGTYDAGTGVWTIGSLANGASASLTIEGTVDAGEAGNVITNTLAAPASGDQPDPSTTGDDLIESVTVAAPALSLTKTADDNTDRTVGDTILYTYTATNTGNVDIADVVISDDHTSASGTNSLPVAGEAADAGNSADSTDANAGDGVWDVLAPGDVVTFTASYVVTEADALAGAAVTNTATATGTPIIGGALTEPTAMESVTIVAPSADLAITKTNTPGVNGEVDQAADTLTSGGTTTYTLTVTNNGPDGVTGAVVSDVVGSGLTCEGTDAVTISGDGVPAGSFTIADLTGAGIALERLEDTEAAVLSYSCTVN